MIEEDLSIFLKEWNSPSEWMSVHTSGSTGEPKEIQVSKMKMLNSARMTCEYLNLKKNDKALLCMSLDYIAGKMMVVRALCKDMNLILREPSGHPLKDIEEPIDFAAMIPLQVWNSLQNRKEKERLSRIKTLIIGGGSIDADLEKALKTFPNKIYSTYGMTETLSHIALRRINGDEASLCYHPLPGIKLSISSEDTLIIEAPKICDNILYTNDIVNLLSDGSFEVIGRKDNVVNTGGIKIQIEEVEKKLQNIILSPFAITSIPDAKFGEKLVLLITSEAKTNFSYDILKDILEKYEIPKEIIVVDKIPITKNNKIDRISCKHKASEMLEKK